MPKAHHPCKPRTPTVNVPRKKQFGNNDTRKSAGIVIQQTEPWGSGLYVCVKEPCMFALRSKGPRVPSAKGGGDVSRVCFLNLLVG